MNQIPDLSHLFTCRHSCQALSNDLAGIMVNKGTAQC